ncbi:MAG: chemotaxis protein CheA [Geobacter sp.]|nr:MAG: chemotaxis protein CheA [Geobacter sp.]
MDMSQYRELFISESREYLRAFNELVVALENDAEDREKIDSLFRTAHSIKGMAASMGYVEITDLAHKIEDFMDKLRKGLLLFEPVAADLLLEGADLLESMVGDVDAGVSGSREFYHFLQRLGDYAPPLKNGDTPTADAKVKEAGREKTAEERSEKGPESGKSIRVKTEVLDNLINITGELITNKHRLMTIGRETGGDRLEKALYELSLLLRGLHDEVLNVRLMPFSSIADRFTRIVRDLARTEGKEVTLEIVGKEIEVDRGILEELADPLLHIIRNAVDHGLETPPERQVAGKQPQGNIRLSALREKDCVVITIEDDGKGMVPSRLVATAIEKGIMTSEKARHLSTREALLLVCSPGFSTAREVTDVSGRGVGMDIVRSTIRTLGGTLAIDSAVGKGTSITLKLPLTIAIIDVLMVSSANLTFAVPVRAILRIMEIGRHEISTDGKNRVFFLNEEPIPLLSMSKILGIVALPPRDKIITLLVTEVRGRKVALVVDRIVGHQEVFVKPVGRPLDRMKGLAGGAIMGNGEVIFILDVANLL